MDGLAKTGLILGIVGCALSALLLTAPLGLICGILAVIFGTIAYAKRRIGGSGIILGVFSLLIVAIWIGSIISILQIDQTFTLPS